MKKLMGAAAALLAMAVAAPALAGSGNPASDTASATATVISPLTVAKQADLVFGKVVQPTAGQGTATIAASGSGTTQLSGLTAPGSQGTNAAHFTIAGDSTSQWTATVVAPSTLNAGVSNTIAFAASNSTLTGSPTDVYVGGQITVTSTTVPATYTGTITVSAQYN